jgi:hypothetical protein
LNLLIPPGFFISSGDSNNALKIFLVFSKVVLLTRQKLAN